MNPVAVTPVFTSCLSCGSNDIDSTMEADSFEYGIGSEKVVLTAEVPVHHCRDCGASFSTSNVEDVRHEAVCAYLKLLNPKQIREVRRRYEVSQAQFADVTRIGRASLARWENGQLLQNSSIDSLLYLLRFEDNWKRLKDRVLEEQRASGTFKPKLREISDAEAEIIQLEADSFEIFSDCEET